MHAKPVLPLHTGRLILRAWREEDLEPFAVLNGDPDVMEFFPSTLAREHSDALAGEISRRLEKNGWGFWAVERKEDGRFLGFVGLNRPSPPLPFGPCTEIAWRLDKPFWGQGYAFEAALRALEYGFSELALAEIVAFTALPNTRSISLMRRLGMQDSGQNFMHPDVPSGSPLKEHCLYKMTRDNWAKSRRMATR